MVVIFSIVLLAGCGNSGGQQSSGTPSNSAGPDAPAAPGSTGEDEEEQVDEGDRIRVEISNEDTKKGYLSAICPASWYNHSVEETLFFSESETPGDYTKPYIMISYAPTATFTGGSGEDIEFEIGVRNWEGLYNDEYHTYNVTHQLEGGGGLIAASMGLGPDEVLYEMVLRSIWVEF